MWRENEIVLHQAVSRRPKADASIIGGGVPSRTGTGLVAVKQSAARRRMGSVARRLMASGLGSITVARVTARWL